METLRSTLSQPAAEFSGSIPPWEYQVLPSGGFENTRKATQDRTFKILQMQLSIEVYSSIHKSPFSFPKYSILESRQSITNKAFAGTESWLGPSSRFDLAESSVCLSHSTRNTVRNTLRKNTLKQTLLEKQREVRVVAFVR